jgi:hypothetical protein
MTAAAPATAVAPAPRPAPRSGAATQLLIRTVAGVVG